MGSMESAGWIGGIVGALIGVAGGVFGTWLPIRNAKGAHQRAYLVRAAWASWAVVLAFLAGLLLLPSPWNRLLWIPYVPALVLGIRALNAGQARARERDLADGAA